MNCEHQRSKMLYFIYGHGHINIIQKPESKARTSINLTSRSIHATELVAVIQYVLRNCGPLKLAMICTDIRINTYELRSLLRIGHHQQSSDDAMQLATWHYVYVLCNLASSIELGISKQSIESDAIVCSEYSRSKKWDKNKWHTSGMDVRNVAIIFYVLLHTVSVCNCKSLLVPINLCTLSLYAIVMQNMDLNC